MVMIKVTRERCQGGRDQSNKVTRDRCQGGHDHSNKIGVRVVMIIVTRDRCQGGHDHSNKREVSGWS